VALAILFNELLLGALGVSMGGRTLERVRMAQLAMLTAGAVLVACSLAVARWSAARHLAERPWVGTLLLAVLSVLIPVWILEWTLRPFSPVPVPVTGAYMRDADLGWRLRPGFVGRDLGGGPVVEINAKGLRGPEIHYAKREGVKRILYLGDSVTFGWLLDGSGTFPQRVQRQIERITRLEIETINAGVGGYSPWQEHLYLSREGLRYDPDLVVLGFVLNDVTEKFALVRFGGRWEGTQLAMTADTFAKRLPAQSALAYQARRLIRSLRPADNSQAAARRAEELQVSHLVSRPEDPRVREAWQLTLENVGKIFQLCRERGIPVVLVIFPFTFQFEDVARRSGPQATLTAFAREQGVPALDLLPVLAEQLERAGATPDLYFFDADHLTPSGSEAVARALVAFLREQGLLNPD